MISVNRNKKTYGVLLKLSAILALVVFSLFLLSNTEASSIEELEKEIQSRQSGIESLEAEIARYQGELQKLSQEANTLENAVQTLETSRRKLQADINLTESKMSEKNSNIEELNGEIANREQRIEQSRESMAETIRRLDQAGTRPLITVILSFENINDLLMEMEELERLQGVIRESIQELNRNKEELEEKKKEEEEKKRELEQLQRELNGQRQVVEHNKQEQESLLVQTQNTESEYQRLVKERREQKEAFERELFRFEAELKERIDPAGVPSQRPGLLSWPLDNIFVTQQFGITAASGRLYASGSHPGVDFRASLGTPVYSAQRGIVKGVGNTDSIPGCFSYGKWVLVEHSNGLSTMYAHLSVISVETGQEVSDREIIGYSGNTGWSTGPHLHLEVYVSEGVEVQPYSSSINCKSALIPLATKQGSRLDPMSYLPPLQN